MGIMGALVRIGLMDYSEEDLSKMSPEQRAKATGTALDVSPVAEVVVAAPEPVSEPVGQVMAVETLIPEGLDIADIYADANIGSSPYSYEKFVKLIDGLAALDDTAKKAALAAMDAADDTWTVGDISNDLAVKRAALVQYQRDIEATVVDLEEKATAAIAETKTQSDERVAAMRAQIAELEQNIQNEFQATGKTIGELHGQLAANKSAGERESQRIGAVVFKMTTVEKTYFSQPVI